MEISISVDVMVQQAMARSRKEEVKQTRKPGYRNKEFEIWIIFTAGWLALSEQ